MASQNVVMINGTSEFDSMLADAGDKPVLVDFFAEWCGPCHALAPIIDELADEAGDTAVIAKVDVDANRELAEKFQVMSIPTVVVFKNGAESDKQIGVASKSKYLEMIAA